MNPISLRFDYLRDCKGVLRGEGWPRSGPATFATLATFASLATFATLTTFATLSCRHSPEDGS
jgi:hypothetical protein